MNQILKAFSMLLIVALAFPRKASSQDSSSLYSQVYCLPGKIFKQVDEKSEAINKRLTKQTDKYLGALAKEERRLRKLLARKDSMVAKRLFDDAQVQYADMRNKVNSVSGKAKMLDKKYMGHLDSLKTTFKFIGASSDLLKKMPESGEKITRAIGRMDDLQTKFTQAEEVRKFIEKRKQLLTEQMNRFGLSKSLRAYKKQVYYYRAQVDEYKRMYDDPSKLESKALELLKQYPAFKEFFNKNSQLAGMFRMPGSSPGESVANLAGLQTRDAIQKELMQKFGNAANIQQTMSSQIQAAKGQLGQLKDKFKSLQSGDLGNGDTDIPDFKPNDQKTKSFMNRLEYGTNLQTVKANYFFPSTSDIGLSIGYKLNDKSIVGLGGSYKMGWGKDIRHISISHQGMGLRSFVDYKLKGSIWLSGGGELNYRSQFSSFEVLNDYTAWQKSALVGLSKKYQAGKKLKGNAQIMYDALWKGQVPRTQPVVFRIGYSIK